MRAVVSMAAIVVACTPLRAPALALAPAPAPAPASAPTLAPALAPAPSITLLAAGDIELGRAMGQRLLANPAHDPLASIAPLLAAADIRFANLEGPLSEQKGETISPNNSLVFTGPPAGADALARAGITIVSTANNHAWDYGKRALVETLDNLDRVGVLHVGTGRTESDAYKAVVVERRGMRIAFLAVTDVWNHGPLVSHEARAYVARADRETLANAIVATKKDPSIDAVVVSFHGGDEYNDAPLARARDILHAAIDAGADVVIGHHPHVVQGMEWRAGRPILYSLGNLLMQMHKDHAWTGYGYLARLTITRSAATRVEACPYRIVGLTPLPFAGDAARTTFESVFFAHLRDVSSRVAITKLAIGAPSPDGCATIAPTPPS
jgi:poly-gamma-glutamate capsule biosynthesis protein CapA/YwtB (metallophosphatase superfamily)